MLGCVTLLCSAAAAAMAIAQQSAPAALPIGPARFRADIQSVQRSLPRIRDRGAATFFLAWAYAHLGNLQKSLALLKQCPIEEGFDPSGVDAFQPLKSNAEFRGLVERVHRQFPPVHGARVAFTIGDSELFPEGIAADAARRIFYLGSEYHDKIVRVTETGAYSDFVKEGVYDLMPVGGVHVDAADHSVWAATDPGPKNRSELVHFDASGKLIERYTAPGSGPRDLNDFVLRGEREIYVTDTFADQVYRFDRRTHEFSRLEFPRPIFYPNGVTLTDDGNFLYVADMLGVFRVDLRRAARGSAQAAKEVDPDRHFTLAGIDGLYWHHGGLVGIQYGAGAYRVVQWRLSRDGLRVASAEMLEYRTPLVKNPTTGAIVGEKLYFMANTGIENLDDNGHIMDRAKLEPVTIAVVRLE